MPRRLCPSLFALAFLAAAPAAAEVECDGNTVEMTACIWDAYEEADAELNELWPQVVGSIEASDWLPQEAAKEWKSELIAAQRAWVTFKEKDCNGAVAFEWYGGSGANFAVGACLYGKTRDRIDDLRSRYLGQ